MKILTISIIPLRHQFPHQIVILLLLLVVPGLASGTRAQSVELPKSPTLEFAVVTCGPGSSCYPICPTTQQMLVTGLGVPLLTKEPPTQKPRDFVDNVNAGLVVTGTRSNSVSKFAISEIEVVTSGEGSHCGDSGPALTEGNVICCGHAVSCCPASRVRVCGVDGRCLRPSVSGTNVAPNTAPAPVAMLAQNTPNPFFDVTQIRYTLPSDCEVSLTLCDLMGHVLRTLEAGPRFAGMHELSLNRDALRSGPYWYVLATPSGIVRKKLMVRER